MEKGEGRGREKVERGCGSGERRIRIRRERRVLIVKACLQQGQTVQSVREKERERRREMKTVNPCCVAVSYRRGVVVGWIDMCFLGVMEVEWVKKKKKRCFGKQEERK